MILRIVFIWFLLIGSAQAANLLSGYTGINNNLRLAATALGSNPRTSVTQLETARDTFRRISPEIRAQKLIPGGNRAFDQARTAISRGSRTDLEAQSLQIRRILERALYEELFVEMASKKTTAAQFAGVLGRAFELPNAQQVELKSGVARGQTNRVRALLETGVANLMPAKCRQQFCQSNRHLFQHGSSRQRLFGGSGLTSSRRAFGWAFFRGLRAACQWRCSRLPQWGQWLAWAG
jgi:hypothetical protein